MEGEDLQQLTPLIIAGFSGGYNAGPKGQNPHSSYGSRAQHLYGFFLDKYQVQS